MYNIQALSTISSQFKTVIVDKLITLTSSYIQYLGRLGQSNKNVYVKIIKLYFNRFMHNLSV